MTYPKLLVLIQIWRSKSKYLRIEALVKIFCRYIKVFLALKVRNSVFKKLIFIKLVFNKSDFLDLVNFDFFDFVKSNFINLAKFAIDDRFLIFKLIPLLLISLSVF